jgi:CheY-like chemotaxis protein
MKKRILLVDDESSLRRSLSLGLSQRGYETDPCEDGISALKKLELLDRSEQTPSAIVLDIQLPDIEGTKLAKIIKFKYPGIPVILITGYTDRLNPQEVKDLKVMAYLEKPFSVDKLAELFKSSEVEEAALEQQEQEERSVSTYLFLKLEDEENFFETYREFYYMQNVLYCDAVKGEYDMVLLVQGNSYEECQGFKDKIEKRKGVLRVEDMSVEVPVFDENIMNIIDTAEDALFTEEEKIEKQRDLSNRVCSYITLEIEKEKLENIYTSLRLNENVVSCDYTSGRFNLVLMVYGTYFGEIDKFIQNRVAPLNGVLKVKEFPIINIFEM